MSAETLVIVSVMLPLLGSVGTFVAPRGARWIGLAAAVLLAPVSFRLARVVFDSGGVVHELGGWTTPLGIHLQVDGLSALLLLAVAVVGLAVSVYSHGYFGGAGEKAGFFWPLWMFLIAGLNAMFVSGDVFNIYVTLELIGLAAASLVALAGRPVALRSALRYLFVSLTGSLLYLLGVALLYGAYGVLDLTLLASRVELQPHSVVALVLITGGLMMKTALFPMHFWLPPAHSSAPAPVSAALSALVIKGGFYALVRIWFGVFGDLIGAPAAQAIGILGAAAILWGSVQALCQSRVKLVVAYSTVAQVGYLFLAFPLAVEAADPGRVWTAMIMLLLSHATAKSAMFLAAGNVQRLVGHDDMDALRRITRRMPLTAFAIGAAGVSLVGLPPTAGFMGKWLLIGAALDQGQWWWVVVLLGGSLLAAAYMVRVLAPAFVSAGDEVPRETTSRRLEWTALALALLSILLGFYATVPARLLDGVLAAGGLT